MEKTIPLRLRRMANDHPEAIAQFYKNESDDFVPVSFADFEKQVEVIGAAFYSLGIRRESRVGLIADNRREWLLTDLAILSLGAADVPRGSDVTDGELVHILSFSDTEICVVETPELLRRVANKRDSFPKLKTFVLMSGSAEKGDAPRCKIVNWDQLPELGEKQLKKTPRLVTDAIDQGDGDDVATLIYTSGTTGTPKGVMLTHRNFLHQVEHVPELIDVTVGDIWLCVLPVWHSFERIMQYVSLGSGSALAYSKPIGKIMLADFQKVRPTWMASVPRIWEAIRSGIYRNVKTQSKVSQALFSFFVAVGSLHSSLAARVQGRLPRFKKRVRVLDAAIGIIPYLLLFPLKALGDKLVFSKIRARLGGRFVAGISGGGALPPSIDGFFSSAGILLLEGYGLTETGPVLGVRAQHHPVPGTVGPVFPGTEIRIVDESGEELPPGEQGLIMARGPQVMKGYYKQPELTAEMIDEDGWLNTGDLGMLTWDNEIKITGRAKDTIVLRGGENVEPLPIEQKISESEFVSTAVVVGQDEKFLGALIVPEFDELERWATEQNVLFSNHEDLVDSDEVHRHYAEIANSLVSPQNGFKSFERVYRVEVLSSAFEVGDELSAKQEIKRFVIYDKYAERIKKMFVR